MTTVRLTDAVIPVVYESYQAVDNPELTAFWQSGVVASSALLNTIASQGGIGATIPYWGDLDPNEEPNYSNDDPADVAVASKLGSGFMFARKAFLNKSYAAMDLVSELAGSNPMQRIRNRFGTYWTRQWQRRLIAQSVGIVANNVASNGGDMGVDASTVVFDADMVIDADATMGDAAGNFRVIAVHSAVKTRMVKNDQIVYIPDSNGNLTIATFKDMRVVVDDSMPVLSGTAYADGAVYLSLMFGSGAVGFGATAGQPVMFGEGEPLNPTWVFRYEQQGNGGGNEEIGERNTWMLHPFGYSWVEPSGGAALTEFSPQLSDLRKATVWSRQLARKQIPFAWIKSLA